MPLVRISLGRMAAYNVNLRRVEIGVKPCLHRTYRFTKKYYFDRKILCREFYELIRLYIADRLEALDIYVSRYRYNLTLLSTRHSSYAIERKLRKHIRRYVPFMYARWMLHYRAARHAEPRRR